RKVCARVIARVKKAKSPDANALRRLAIAHLMREEYSAAGTAFNETLEANPSDGKAHLYLAINLVAQDQYAASKQHLAKGIELAKAREDYLYPIEEAEEIAKRRPEDAHANEIVEALLRAAKDTKTA